MSSSVPPILLAFVPCELVRTNPDINRKYLDGLFRTLESSLVPYWLATISIYIAITECYGSQSLEVRLVDCNIEVEPILQQSTIEHTPAGPRDFVEVLIQLNDVSIPTYGEYRLQLFINGEFTIERDIILQPENPVEE